MVESNRGIIRAGAVALRRAHPLFWVLYALNLLLALMAALPAFLDSSAVLDSSLASDGLYRGFDLAAFAELMAHTDPSPSNHIVSSLLLALLFLPLMFFLTPGILETYRREPGSGIRPGAFIETCTTFFWRFVRLFLFVGVAFVLVRLFSSQARQLASSYADRSLREGLARGIEVGALLFGLALLLVLRICYDIAQAWMVVSGDRRARIAALAGFKLVLSNFGSLLWIYLRTFLAAGVLLAIPIYIWFKLPPDWVTTTFVLAQLVAFITLATRLWQRACSVLWMERHRPVPVVVEEPLPIELPQVEAAATPLAETSAVETAAVPAVENLPAESAEPATVSEPPALESPATTADAEAPAPADGETPDISTRP